MYSLDYGMVRCIMGNFMLFAWDDYYPGGPLSDYRGRFDSLEDALNAARAFKNYDNLAIMDLSDNTFIEYRPSEEDQCDAYD
jgi:hypothetical protein